MYKKSFGNVCKSVYICNMAQKRYNISIDKVTMDAYIEKCKLAKKKYSNEIEKLITKELRKA